MIRVTDMKASDALNDFLADTVSDLVAIPSPSGQEKAVADYVERQLRESGLKPERDKHDNVWVEVGHGDKRLHANAHLDTVVPVDGWNSDPFKARIEGDRLYGLGASDCKGGVAALLWLASRVKPDIRVMFSFTVCEEGQNLPKPNGSERMAMLGGDWALACEPTCDENGPLISIGTQGHAQACVTFTGKAAHSSVPEDGRNAIYHAASFCSDLEKLNASYAVSKIAPGAEARATVAPTIIAGGKLSNIIPDECRVTVSRRLAPGEDIPDFESELKRLLAGRDAVFDIASDGAGALVDMNGAFLRTAREASVTTGGGGRLWFTRGRTDAIIYARAGMDTLTLGPGQLGQCHVANEYVDLAAAEKSVRLLETLINSLG